MQERKQESAGFKTTLILITGLVVMSLIGCSDEDKGVGPESEPQPVSSCERFDQATMTFENTSSRTVYDVILDGSRIGSIGPGSEMSRTVASGSHTILFKFSNNGQRACTESTPNVAKCSHHTYGCSSDL